VDRVDQVMAWRSCKAKSRRWTMTVLYYILDTSRHIWDPNTLILCFLPLVNKLHLFFLTFF
jgi:hypothetical protein